MKVIVQKYGGSSVASFEKLEGVADEIAASQRDGASIVVVVSAMAGTTDELVELGRRAWHSGGALPSRPAQPPARELDLLVSTGERISMTLLSIMLQARGLSAISFTGSQSGIVTTERHFDARIVDVRPFRIQQELEKGKIVIVAGFQGVSREKEVTTLGRGGSDTSAVALAAALGADSCDVCSDVDGVYSADPRHIKTACHLPSVSYGQALEMALAGAKVLHSEAIRYAARHQVRINARRTGDRVKNLAPRHTQVTQLASCPQAAVVTDEKVALLRSEPANLDRIMGVLSELSVTPWDVHVPGESAPSAWVSVRLRDTPSPESVETGLKDALQGTVEIKTQCSAVSLVAEQTQALGDLAVRAGTEVSDGQLLEVKHPARITRVIAHPRSAGDLAARWHRLLVPILNPAGH